MKDAKSLLMIDREQWRKWLARNAKTESVVWLIFFKKHTGKVSIPYEDAVEEALCFGWIDSIVKRVDDDQYARKFTRRTNTDNWSNLNKRRVAKLIREGRMTADGLAKASYLSVEGGNVSPEPVPPRRSPRPEPEIPLYMKRALAANKKAQTNFYNLAPSYRRLYIGWIISAKKQETRDRRLKEAIDLLEQNKKIGLK